MSKAKPPPTDAAQADDAREMRQRADRLETLIAAVENQRTSVHNEINYAHGLAERGAQLDKRRRVG